MAYQRHEIIDFILKKLFEAEHRRLDSLCVDLIGKNNVLKNQSAYGFILGGERHTHPDYREVRALKDNLPSLHLRLFDEGNHYHTETRKIEQDWTRVRQVLVKLLKDVNDRQDVRDALPEALIKYFPGTLEALARTRPPAWNLQGNPRAMREFEKLLPKIEMYSIMGILY